MAYYETVIILNPTKEEKELKQEIRAYEDYIQTFSDKKKVDVDFLGKKTLAYEMKKHKAGYYVVYRYQAKASNITDLERAFRINDNVLKFITIRCDEIPTLEDYIPEEKKEVKSEQEPDVKTNKINALDILLPATIDTHLTNDEKYDILKLNLKMKGVRK